MRTRARRVAVLVFDEVELLDVAAPVEALSLAGRRWNFRPFKVELVGESPGLVATRNQIRLEATRDLSAAAGAEIVIVPGGYGARRLCETETLREELTALLAGAELVGAIGWGVALAARAGCAAGARVAVPDDARAALLEHAPDAVFEAHDAVVRTGRLISARASGAALELGLALIQHTLGPKLVAMVSADLGLDRVANRERIDIRYGPPKP